MIDRVLELRLTAFRAFCGEQIIPLDADVILIHGSNGTAKTSLLSGLEFALTGEVCDLQAYAGDYPRCLRHLGAKENPSATIRFRDADGQEREITHEVIATGGLTRSPFTLSAEERRFFLDRCYLSQSSLGRLLENYQACDSEQPEQPLVRFIRELLGLDLLENLTSGLHETGHVTRIEKSVPAFREAREVETFTAQQITEHEARRPGLVSAWNSALADLQRIEGEVGAPASETTWDIDSIETRLKAMDESANDHAAAGYLQKLRRADGRLQSSLGLLGNGEDSETRLRLEQQIEKAQATHAGIQTRLANLLERVQATLLELGLRAPETDNLAATLETAVAMLGEARNRLDADARRLAEMSAELLRLRIKRAEIVTSLTSHPPSALGEIAARQRVAELLAAISNHIHGNECPVCRRDYSELNSGSLAERITSEIASIGADAKALEDRERRRAALELDNVDLTRRIAALEQQLAREQPIADRYATKRQAIASLVEECADAGPDCQSFLRLTPAMIGFRTELAILDTRRQQRATAAGDLMQLAHDIEVNVPIDSVPSQTAALVTAHLAAAIEKTERQLTGASRLRNGLSVARVSGQALTQLEKELKTIRHRHEQASDLIRKMRGLIQEGKDLSKAATNAKKKLLDQVFNETLNRLWQDLFRRLAKNERFQPWLGDPTSERGQIRTTIQGRAAIGEPFSQFSAVASSGNVSTAALSLFLALHLIEQPRHRILVLDDPVQNMDDVHVVQLAALLRSVVRKTGRSLSPSTNERSSTTCVLNSALLKLRESY